MKIKLSLKLKLTLSMCAIAVMLLISCIISVMEYRRMSNYVSELIADDISSINTAQRLADMSNKYNLDILAVIGDDNLSSIPEFDDSYFKSHCDMLASSYGTEEIKNLADSIMYSYSAYMLTSLELETVLKSNFIDSRSWYFFRLQPRFERLRGDIDKLTDAIYESLQQNSTTFERGFYRSVIPGLVAVGVGLLLIILLLFFILAYYVKPLYKMLDSIKAYVSSDRKYVYSFEGDDQMTELNSEISDLVNENRQLRNRIKSLREKQ